MHARAITPTHNLNLRTHRNNTPRSQPGGLSKPQRGTPRPGGQAQPRLQTAADGPGAPPGRG
jgi:hypothetical protein